MRKNRFRIILLVMVTLFALLLSSCSLRSNESATPRITEYITPIATKTPDPVTPSPSPSPTATPVPTPTPRSGPDVVGLYVSGSGGRVLLTEYESRCRRGEDVATFNTFASNVELLNYAKYREMLVDTWFSFPNAIDYKIGYELRYTLTSGEEIIVTITKPSDITHTEYLEVYLYDSVQQYGDGRHYTHLADEEMDAETLLYSFKLTPGKQIGDVERIWLKNFVYKYQDTSDFDSETGRYIGTVSYEIEIIKK